MGLRGGSGREELISAHGYDTKYAMHCARLGFQCLELLSTRCLTLPIEGDVAEWLRAVRRGDGIGITISVSKATPHIPVPAALDELLAVLTDVPLPRVRASVIY